MDLCLMLATLASNYQYTTVRVSLIYHFKYVYILILRYLCTKNFKSIPIF
jgi:hypothetical protein